MTENGDGQSSSNFAPMPVTTSSTPSQAPVESERTFKQSEVNEIAARRATEAVDRYRRESSMASHQQNQQVQPQYNAPVQPQYNGMSEQEFRRVAAEEAQKARDNWIQESNRTSQEQEAQKIASEFFTKIEAGKSNLPDFDKVMADIDLRSIPYHVTLANMVDNTADVMYELAKNPSKIGAIENLINIDIRAGRQPKLALSEIKRLSQSIKDNQQAAKFKSPNEPLSQMRPSNAGTDNRGALSVSDYKRKYRV